MHYCSTVFVRKRTVVLKDKQATLQQHMLLERARKIVQQRLVLRDAKVLAQCLQSNKAACWPDEKVKNSGHKTQSIT